jgi:hypothetical protein
MSLKALRSGVITLIPCAVVLSGFLGLSACGARTGLEAGPPKPPSPECEVDTDCPTYGDFCNPVKCVPNAPDAGTKPLGGTCEDQPKVDCNDNDPCTTDTCTPETGACSYKIATLDLDGDGYRGPIPGTIAGQPGSCGDDCDDTNAAAHPGGVEICDGVDNDCNGIIDDNATFVPISSEVVVSSSGLQPAAPGGLAWSGKVYASLYSGKSSGSRVFMSILNPGGDKVTPPGEQPFTFVNADSFAGPTVWVGDRFGVVWQDRRNNNNYQTFFSLLGEDGAKKLADTQISFDEDGLVGAVNPAMAWNGTEFLVAWQLAPGGIYNLFGTRVDVGGTPIGSPIALTTSENGLGNESPSIAAGKDGVGVAWFVGDALSKTISFQIFSTDLTKPTIPPMVLTDGTTNAVYPTVVWNKDRYIVAWADFSAKPRAIYATAIGPDGSTLVPPKAITHPGAFHSRWPYLKPLGDRLLLVFSDDRDDQNAGYEIYSRMIDNELGPIGSEQRITNAPGDSLHPIASFGPDGNVGVLFRDDRLGQEDVWFTHLACVAGGPPPPNP